MGRIHRVRLAALVLTVAMTAACSSTVTGTGAPGSAAGTAPTNSAPGDSAPGDSAPSTAGPGTSRPGNAPSSAGPSAPDGSSTPAPATRPSSGGGTGGSAGADGTVGDPGIGDPYYPASGNGGYQIDSYDLNLSYDPTTNDLESTATLAGSVLAKEGLTQFNLDLQPSLEVSEVQVNSKAATFRQEGAELVITPSALLPAESALSVVVTYGGQPGLITGGTANLGDGGWYRTASNGAVAIGEPYGASAWYPVNEHPADTATFAVTATVPDGWNVISNGVQRTDLPAPPAGKQIYRWELDEPVASYLTTIYIDKFKVVEGQLKDGTPVVSAIAPDANPDATDLANSTAPIIDVLSKYFGPYPFKSAGGVFTGLKTGFALETAGRPTYGGGPIASFDTVVHELAHQWYGDDVTIQRWSDICINECFASYAPWLWAADTQSADLDAEWKQQMAARENNPDFWSSPLVDMGAGNEFTRVYTRGPLALHALRNEIGDDAFLTLLKKWPATYGGKNATFENLEDMVNSLAGRDVRPFMDAWFRGTTVPAEEFRYPGKLGN